MSTTENQNPTPPTETTGAFTKDKLYGKRLDDFFALGEPFLLLGWKNDEIIDTKFGKAQSVAILVQKLDQDTGIPKGAPFKVSTVASAIVEKVQALTPEELAAGPVVFHSVVQSKARAGQHAAILQWIRNLADGDDYSEFGLDASTVGKIADLARPSSERIGF